MKKEYESSSGADKVEAIARGEQENAARRKIVAKKRSGTKRKTAAKKRGWK